MIPITYPEVIRVEVIATQPIPADIRSIRHIQVNEDITLNEVTYLVKINLTNQPPITSRGLDVYVDDYHISRYSSFPGGIYFKIFNPRFFEEYAGKRILFSADGVTMYDSGYQLPASAENVPGGFADSVVRSTTLPTQEQVLNQ